MISCADQTDQANKDNTDSPGTDSSGTVTLASSRFVTTPETMMFVIHKVADYDKWLDSYEHHDSVRLANGIHNYVIGYSTTDRTRICRR